MLELRFERNEAISDTSASGILHFRRLCRSYCLETEGSTFLTSIRSAPTASPFLHSFLIRSVIAIMPSSVDRLGWHPTRGLGSRLKPGPRTIDPRMRTALTPSTSNLARVDVRTSSSALGTTFSSAYLRDKVNDA